MDIIDQFEKELKRIINNLKDEIRGVRAGRPSASLFDGIKVDYHGQITPLSHLGNISVKPPREINIQIWDESVVKKVADTIDTSNLNVTSNIEGNAIRIFLPELSKERREELVRHVKKTVEEHRIKVRQIREEFNKKIDSLYNSNEITEDNKFKLRDLVQQATDSSNKEIDEVFKTKEAEINE